MNYIQFDNYTYNLLYMCKFNSSQQVHHPKKHVGDKELKLKRQCCNINEFHTPLLPPWRNFATSKKLLQTETFTCIPI